MLPTAKPKEPAADTASGVAARAVERTARKSIVIKSGRVGSGRDGARMRAFEGESRGDGTDLRE